MSLPKNIEAYEDVRIVLDNVLLNNGGTYILRSEKDARQWARRAYRFRVLANKQGEAQYNHLVLQVRDTSVKFVQHKVSGTLLDPEGQPVELVDKIEQEVLEMEEKGDVV